MLKKIFWGIAYTFSGIWLCVLIFFILDKPGDCSSSGDVWDYNEKRCRKDCLTWNKLHGCIYMNEEYQRLFMACAEKTAECNEKRLDELHIEACQKYNGALNLEYGYCDFEFTPDQCFKLEGKWQYPDVCDKPRAGKSDVQ